MRHTLAMRPKSQVNSRQKFHAHKCDPMSRPASVAANSALVFSPLTLITSVAMLAILSLVASFVAPVAFAQRGAGGAQSSGAVAAGPAVAAHSTGGAAHSGGGAPAPQAAAHAAGPIHAGGASRTSVRVAPVSGSHVSGSATNSAAIGVRRVGVGTGVAPRRFNVASGLAHLPLFPDTNFADSPGLGFDFSHFAAINNANNNGRARDRFNNGVPFGFGGFLLSSPEVIVVEGQPGDAPQGAAEENIASRAENGEGDRENLQDQFLPSSTGPVAPVRDAAEYVFVRRDGSLLFAVAYSWDNNTLRYVTRDGFRRSIAREALDIDATQQFNEQRGLDFRPVA